MALRGSLIKLFTIEFGFQKGNLNHWWSQFQHSFVQKPKGFYNLGSIYNFKIYFLIELLFLFDFTFQSHFTFQAILPFKAILHFKFQISGNQERRNAKQEETFVRPYERGL